MSSDKPDMDELSALRGFRAHAAHASDAAEQDLEHEIRMRITDLHASGTRHRPRRYRSSRTRWALRQVPVAMVSAVIVIALSFNAGEPGGAPAVASTPAAPLLNKSANRLTTNTSDKSGTGSTQIQATPVTSQNNDSWIYYNVDTGEVAMSPASSPDTMKMKTLPPERIIDGPANLDPSEFDNLPIHTDALLDALRTGAAYRHLHRDLDYLPFRVAASYVSNPSIPAPARAAFLRALARMNGVDTAGPGSDILGRSGVVIARLDATSGVRQEYVFNADTGRVLEQLEFLTEGSTIGACSAGTALLIEVYDDQGYSISPSTAPWGSWPDVRPECTPS